MAFTEKHSEIFPQTNPVDWGDRKEAYMLFKRLDKRERIAFVNWACKQVSSKDVVTKITETTGDMNELWWDLMNLCYTHGLSIETAGKELVRLCRRK